MNLPASVTSPSASAANGTAPSTAPGGGRLGSQNAAKKNRRTERAGGKYLMMSQDFTGISKMQDLGQRPGQRRVKHPVKGLHPQIQGSEQRTGHQGRNANLIGSSYAFTGATGSGLGSVNPASVNLSTGNKHEIYKQSGRQNSQVAAVHKPPRTMQHRFNNFFQYGQQQRKSNSKLAGVPSQSQYQPQNPPTIVSNAGGVLGGANARAGSGAQATAGAPEGAPGAAPSSSGGPTEQPNAAQGQ